MKDKVFQMRIDNETQNKLRQMHEYYRLPSMSELLRLLIQFAYDEQRYLEYYIEKERGE